MPASKEKAKKVIKESTPAGGGFASFFSLQAGTVMAASIIFGLALTSFFYNLSALNPTVDTSQYTSQYVVAYLFFVIVFFGAMAVTIAAFKFNSQWVLISACILAFAAAIWFILAILCFIPSIEVYKYVCVHNRCPPSVWLFEVSWRRLSEPAIDAHHDRSYTGRSTERSSRGNQSNGTRTASNGTSTDTGFTKAVANATAADGNIAAITGNTTAITGNTTTTGNTTQSTLKLFAAENLLWDGSFTKNNEDDEDFSSSVERPLRMALKHFDSIDREADVNSNFLSPLGGSWTDPKSSSLWNWLLRKGLKDLAQRQVKPFVSSYVPKNPQPGKTDSSIGMTIFCFIILTLFWVYSLWTMFSYHKELKQQEREEEELLREHHSPV